MSGPYTVIWAVAAGQKAASEIDEAVRGKKGLSPYVAPPEEEMAVSKTLDEEVVERPQERMRMLSAEKRVRGFEEVELGYTPEQALGEASRCLRCDIQIEEGFEETEERAEAVMH